MHPFLKDCVQSHKTWPVIKQNKTLIFCRLSVAVNTHWLAWVDPDAQTPGRKGCGCRWASAPWPNSSGRGKVLRLQKERVHWGSASECGDELAVALKQSSPLTPSQLTAKIADEATSRPPLRLSQGCHLLFTAASPLTVDQSCVSPPQMPLELLLLLSWWEICVGLLSACSLVLQCGAASDREHRQTQHEQSKREGEGES